MLFRSSRHLVDRRLSTLNHQLSTASSSFPPSPLSFLTDWPWEIVSSHSSATAPESHGNSSHRSTTETDKEQKTTGWKPVLRLLPEVAACAWALKIYLGVGAAVLSAVVAAVSAAGPKGVRPPRRTPLQYKWRHGIFSLLAAPVLSAPISFSLSRSRCRMRSSP